MTSLHHSQSVVWLIDISSKSRDSPTVGPYTISRKGCKDLTLCCVTMIDPATGWFEIAPWSKRSSIKIANIVEQQWFARYPKPTQVTFDQGTEFMKDFCSMLDDEYHIKRKPNTTHNPQANTIVERIHQVVGNMVQTHEVQPSTKEDPWVGVLAAIAYTVCSTYHTTLQATPSELAFGRDMIFNIQHEANWEPIHSSRKQARIASNKQCKNAKRIEHDYKVGDKALLENDKSNLCKYKQPHNGPFIVRQVHCNSTLTLQRGPVLNRINICHFKPYQAAAATNTP